MKRALTRSQMKCCDEYTSKYFGVPSEVLMERAALAVFDEILSMPESTAENTQAGATEKESGRMKKILVLCGTGNNGADGLALCRIFRENGYEADYIIPEDGARHSALFDFQKDILDRYGARQIGSEEASDGELYEKYDVIVDALFGIGLNREVSESVSRIFDIVNNIKKICRVAVDISSGINADNGQVMGNAFLADVTVTFGFTKIGQLLYPGKKYTGRLVCAPIGITERSLEALENAGNDEPQVFNPGVRDVAALYPARPADGNKGTFGKVLIFAGCDTMSGAAVMAAKAAFRSGCGMVRVITVPENKLALQTAVPEAMLTIIGNNESDKVDANVGVGNASADISINERTENELLNAIKWCDVILAGPGIGKCDLSKKILQFIIENAGGIKNAENTCGGKNSENARVKKLVLDADALNIISESEELKKFIKERGNENPAIITPHAGELARLTGKKISELKEDFVKNAVDAAGMLGTILIAKDAVSIVTDGKRAYICNFGNNGMATAGSGDVLSGITAAHAGYLDKNLYAALCSVCVHGLAGNECLRRMEEENIMAGDIIDSLPEAIRKFLT